MCICDVSRVESECTCGCFMYPRLHSAGEPCGRTNLFFYRSPGCNVTATPSVTSVDITTIICKRAQTATKIQSLSWCMSGTVSHLCLLFFSGSVAEDSTTAWRCPSQALVTCEKMSTRHFWNSPHFVKEVKLFMCLDTCKCFYWLH